jgi:sterol desaturase/sphingolipid hydroxylase (fatty acid hydroxylase superfamily)
VPQSWPNLVSSLILGYFATTLALWLAHWFAHLRWSPLAGFHVRGHHALYPSSEACLSREFRFGSGWHDSVYAFIPWLVVLAAGIWMALPAFLAAVVTVEATALVALFSHVHAQFHIEGASLARYAPFLRARARHHLHHDRDVNFSVYDHLWDRIFGTFERA